MNNLTCAGADSGLVFRSEVSVSGFCKARI